jgi:SAM-dependent methyltransferase
MIKESRIRRLLKRVIPPTMVRFLRSTGAKLKDYWEMWYWNRFKRTVPPIPPLDLRVRVGAEGVSIPVFLFQGKQQLNELQSALYTSTEKTFADYSSILDFGCGSGRQTRHLLGFAPAAQVYGVDVDEPSIAWLNAHYQFGVFRHTAPTPPMPIEDTRFDLIYAVSVFTHLNPSSQEAWLSELARVASDGGALLITTHGPVALDKDLKNAPHLFDSSFLPSQSDLEREGFLFYPYAVEEHADAYGRDSVYGSAYYSHDYLKQSWSRYFEKIAIVPSGLNNYQDIVVVSKK